MRAYDLLCVGRGYDYQEFGLMGKEVEMSEAEAFLTLTLCVAGLIGVVIGCSIPVGRR